MAPLRPTSGMQRGEASCAFAFLPFIPTQFSLHTPLLDGQHLSLQTVLLFGDRVQSGTAAAALRFVLTWRLCRRLLIASDIFLRCLRLCTRTATAWCGRRDGWDWATGTARCAVQTFVLLAINCITHSRLRRTSVEGGIGVAHQQFLVRTR